MYSTSNATTVDPVWTDATANVRSFTVSRGRASELSRVDAGTAQIVLNNRARTFDPVINTAIRPMNRWWIREQFSGLTNDVFKGYAESYEQQWVKGSQDASTVVSCADEMKVLTLNKLATTDPPGNSYQDVVMYDRPNGYWPMNVSVSDVAAGHPALVGDALFKTGTSFVNLTGGGIVGDESALFKGAACFAGDGLATNAITPGMSGDVGALSEFTAELWFRRIGALPAATENIVRGPRSGGAITWQITLTTAGTIQVSRRNSGGTTVTVTSTTAPVSTVIGDSGPWYHVVGTVTGGSVRIYVNGVQEASSAVTGSFGATDANETLVVGPADTGDRAYDEIATNRYGLTAARVWAHYTAGALRGFPRDQEPGDRINAVLDSIASTANRRIRTGTRNLTGSYMVGQPALNEVRVAETGESVDAVLFIAKDGAVVFLDDGYRSVSPWNTVQATFDDDGTDFPYNDISLDYSDSFLANIWTGNKVGGTLQTAPDATSISVYDDRTPSFAQLNDLPLTTDADVTTALAAMLAKYKDPMTRITRLEIMSGNKDIIDNVMQREIGDRIRVLRTPPGGGARIDQQLFIQSINIDARPAVPWRVVWGLSPL
jgi:hypothetical protein